MPDDEPRSLRTFAVLRRRKRISQIDMATRLGISQPEISLLENYWSDTLRDDGLEKASKILEIKDPTDLLLSYEEYIRKQVIKEKQPA